MNARIFRIVPCGRRWRRGSPASRSGSVSTTAGGRSIPTSGSGRSRVTRSTGSWHSEASRCLALAPGSIWGSKRWPYYRELAERLAGSVGILVVGGPEDAALAAEITEAVARSGGQAVSGCGRLSVRQAAEAIRRAVVLVTNDSAPLHFAQAVDTPTVAIFGSTVPSFGFGPRGPRDRVVQVGGLACRPCSAHGPPSCPLGHHLCMKSLSVQDVLQAIEETGALRRRD